jgi:putative PIN family toxin of toxin-antitoxin system
MPIKKPVRVVLDTNIVMDLLHFNDRLAQPLKTAISSGQLPCFTDRDCFAEFERVTGYPAFGLDDAARQALTANYLRLVTPCNASADENYPLPRCRDADDQKFLILAARCQADLLITRDKLLLKLARHRRIPPPFAILTAADACQLLDLG